MRDREGHETKHKKGMAREGRGGKGSQGLEGKERGGDGEGRVPESVEKKESLI